MVLHQEGRVSKGLACTILAALGVWTAGCGSDSTGPNAQLVTTYGAVVAIGSGSARTYQVTENGTPTEVGVALSEAALDGLPTAPQMGGYEYVLQLPAGNTTQFQTVGLNWNPTGHPPSTVYTVPHFDVHFYMITSAERGAIDPSDPAFAAKAASLPAAGFQASGYVADPPANIVPHMGLHWTDSNAGEFHNQPFTRTFIYGSWDGRFVFIEPMITRAYLLTHPDEVVPLASPAQHAISGYYPAGYRVSWNAATAEYRIALANLSK